MLLLGAEGLPGSPRCALALGCCRCQSSLWTGCMAPPSLAEQRSRCTYKACSGSSSLHENACYGRGGPMGPMCPQRLEFALAAAAPVSPAAFSGCCNTPANSRWDGMVSGGGGGHRPPSSSGAGLRPGYQHIIATSTALGVRGTEFLDKIKFRASKIARHHSPCPQSAQQCAALTHRLRNLQQTRPVRGNALQ